MPLTNGSGSKSIFFIDWTPTKTNKKKFCLLVFEGTFTSFLKDKKPKRSYKTVGIKVFLTIFAIFRIQEAQKHTAPTDPDRIRKTDGKDERMLTVSLCPRAGPSVWWWLAWAAGALHACAPCSPPSRTARPQGTQPPGTGTP
jgi:hypothetical protein